jgi:soluble lytic murein transglycosylase
VSQIFFLLFSLTFLTAALGGVIESPYPLPMALPSRDVVPESYEASLNTDKCTEKSCVLWKQFVLGQVYMQSSPSRACEIFLKLSEEQDFALKPICLMKAARVCEESPVVQQRLLMSIDDYLKKEKLSKWLKSGLLETQAFVAGNVSDEAFIARVLEATPQQKTKKFKIDLLLEALARAKKTHSPQVKKIENELSKISKAYTKNIAQSDWLSAANEAFMIHDYPTSEKYFKKVITSKKYDATSQRSALDLLRQTYKIGQKKTLALNTAKRLWRWDLKNLKRNKQQENIKHYLSSGLILARMQWTAHNNREARGILKKLLKLNEKPFLSDIYFVLGRMDEEEGRDDLALKEMEEAIKVSSADPGISKSQYQWPYAWLSFKSKKYEQAYSVLTLLAQSETDSGKKSQELFWLAQTCKSLNKETQAKEIFQKIITGEPLGYYTFLSFRELKLEIPKIDYNQNHMEEVTSEPLSKLKKIDDVDWNLFKWLISVGEYSWARKFLSEEVPVPDPATSSDWKIIFSQYAQARYLSPLFGKLSKISPEEKIKILKEHKNFLFPNPYLEIVTDAALNSGLWPEYIYSIMRQESSFDPDSLSPADAYGLLQILPGVAKQVGKRHHISFKKTSDLFDPSINIRLGSYHLRSYWDKFDGQFLLTTAAYNASPETVKNWVAHRYRGDVLQFIEDIPFEETRTYVKLVLRNFINYLLINSQSPTISFPEWCLKGFQVSKL